MHSRHRTFVEGKGITTSAGSIEKGTSWYLQVDIMHYYSAKRSQHTCINNTNKTIHNGKCYSKMQDCHVGYIVSYYIDEI
jgi:hypothetical protein